MSGACGDLSSVSWHELRLSRFRISPFFMSRTLSRQEASRFSQSLNQFAFLHCYKNSFVLKTLQRYNFFFYIAKFYGNIFAILTTINQKEPPRRMAHYTVLYHTALYPTTLDFTALHYTSHHFSVVHCTSFNDF